MTSALIDLDSAPAGPPRPGHDLLRSRTALAALSLLLLALLGPAEAPVPSELPATLIAAQNQDGVFVHGDRLYVVDAAPPGLPRPMRTYRLPQGDLVARAALRIPEAPTGVLPVGDTTLIETTAGERPAVTAIDAATGASRWWRPGEVSGASAAAGLVLITDEQQGGSSLAVDLRTGEHRWRMAAPSGGELIAAGRRDGLPRWLIASDPHHGRLDSYDGRTGRHLATAVDAPSGPIAGAAGDLLLVGGTRDGVLAYDLPALTVRWPLRNAGPSLGEAWVAPDCGDLLCLFRPGLLALDARTGQARWSSDRWNYAERAGDYLIASRINGAPDLTPVTVLDPATGRVRAELGGWRRIPGADGVTYVVSAGKPAYFGRFDPAAVAVRLLGRTDRQFSRCDTGAGAVVCHLTDGPVAIWRF